MQGQHNKSFTFPGYAFNSQEAAVSFDSASIYEIALAAVSANNIGTLTTRTDNDTGVATVQSSHTISDSDTVDVYWSGGVRYGMTASVSSNEITVDGGSGDNLPVQDTAVTVVTQTEIDPCNIDGDNVQIIGVFYRNANDTTAKAHIQFQDAGSLEIHEVDLVHETAQGGLAEIANIYAGETNNYTGNEITKARASHDSAQAATLYVLAGIDSTP